MVPPENANQMMSVVMLLNIILWLEPVKVIFLGLIRDVSAVHTILFFPFYQ